MEKKKEREVIKKRRKVYRHREKRDLKRRKQKKSKAKRKEISRQTKKIIKPWESLNAAEILRPAQFLSIRYSTSPASLSQDWSPTRLARAGCHFRLAFVRPSVWPLVPRIHSCLRHSTARVLFFILIFAYLRERACGGGRGYDKLQGRRSGEGGGFERGRCRQDVRAVGFLIDCEVVLGRTNRVRKREIRDEDAAGNKNYFFISINVTFDEMTPSRTRKDASLLLELDKVSERFAPF